MDRNGFTWSALYDPQVPEKHKFVKHKNRKNRFTTGELIENSLQC